MSADSSPPKGSPKGSDGGKGPRIRSATIQNKLTLLTVCTSLVGLSLACLAFDAFERLSFRSAMTNEFSTLADTVGANAAAALAFDDKESAEQQLRPARRTARCSRLFLRHQRQSFRGVSPQRAGWRIRDALLEYS